jgi:hypothetical protein
VGPQLDWSSYVELAGPISLAPGDVDLRVAEVAAHVVTDVRLDALVAKARR